MMKLYQNFAQKTMTKYPAFFISLFKVSCFDYENLNCINCLHFLWSLLPRLYILSILNLDAFYHVFLCNMILSHFSKLLYFLYVFWWLYNTFACKVIVYPFSWSSSLNWKFFFRIINITALDVLTLSFVCVVFLSCLA